MTRSRASVAALMAALAVAATAAQQVFRSGIDTVLLNVTVTDGRNRPIADLERHDFQVFEDGLLQEIAIFTNEPQPIALSLLLDSSTSMEDDRLVVAQEASIGFARRLGPDDVAQVIAFNRGIEIRQPFTNDVGALEAAIRGIRAGGTTSLYTALYVALSELTRVGAESAERIRRQAIVVLSDGEDTTSLKNYDDVADLAKRSDVAIYAIGLRETPRAPAPRFSQADFALRTLSQMTGGQVFFVGDIKQLPGIYRQIADELATQFFIGYNSKNAQRDGAWRQVGVRVSRPETVVRTRAGYFAPSGRP
jgi:Ca-activated chloride channel family protein